MPAVRMNQYSGEIPKVRATRAKVSTNNVERIDASSKGQRLRAEAEISRSEAAVRFGSAKDAGGTPREIRRRRGDGHDRHEDAVRISAAPSVTQQCTTQRTNRFPDHRSGA